MLYDPSNLIIETRPVNKGAGAPPGVWSLFPRNLGESWPFSGLRAVFDGESGGNRDNVPVAVGAARIALSAASCFSLVSRLKVKADSRI